MHIVPSRGRSELLQRYFDEGKPEQPGVVIIDTDQAAEYYALRYPRNWHLHAVKPMQGFVAKVNYAFKLYPDEPWYTLEGDDMVGRTPHWDSILSDVASRGYVAYGNDLFFGKCTHPYIYGDFCRDLGWVAHPAFKHNYVDEVWYQIAMRLGVLHSLPYVITEAHHYANFKLPFDQTAKERMEKNDGLTWCALQFNLGPLIKKLEPRVESLCR